MSESFERSSIKKPETEGILESAKSGYERKLGTHGSLEMAEVTEEIWKLKLELGKAAEGNEKNAQQKELEKVQERLIALTFDGYIASSTLEKLDGALSDLSKDDCVKFYEQAPAYAYIRPDACLQVAENRKVEPITLEETDFHFDKIQNIESFGARHYQEVAKALLRKELLDALSKKGLDKDVDSGKIDQRVRDYLTTLRPDVGPAVFDRLEGVDVAFGHAYHRQEKQGTVGYGRYSEYDSKDLLKEIFHDDPDFFRDLSVLTTLRQRIGGEDTHREFGPRQTLRNLLEKTAGGVSTDDGIPYRDKGELKTIRAKLAEVSQDLPFN